MARIRTVKPEFWTSEQVVECSPNARLLFIGMWNFCDDGGNHPASLKTLKAEVFPADDCFTMAQIEAMVAELFAHGLIIEYAANARKYWHVTGWHHQKIDKPSYKHPPYIAEQSPNGSRMIDEPSTTEGKGMEGKGEVHTPPAEGASKKPASRSKKQQKTPLPADFRISERVSSWAKEKGHSRLEERLEHFVGAARAKGYTYADWDDALMNAIRDDWAKLGKGHAQTPAMAGAV
jgi:hypothetical protein